MNESLLLLKDLLKLYKTEFTAISNNMIAISKNVLFDVLDDIVDK